jgi:hypothetical protein
MEDSSFSQAVTTYGSLLGTLVTAVATVMLWWVTKTLATETKRLVESSSAAHVVATLKPNKWSMRHADLEVTNTGNATAYDVEIQFDPPLQNGEAREQSPDPFNKISVIKPGRSVSSYISEIAPMLKISYEVAG